MRRCRVAVGELRGELFVKLLEMLIDSVLLYGAQVWGSCRQLTPIEKIQCRKEYRKIRRFRDVAWREAVDSWRREARSHSKLAEVQELIKKGYEARCVEVKCKRRRVLVQLKGGTAALEVETGRWHQ